MDEVEPFKVKDAKKADFIRELSARAEREENLDWAERFIAVCKVIDSALGTLSTDLYAEKGSE